MSHAAPTLPEPAAILRAWMPFKALVGVTAVKTEADHARALDLIEVLCDAVRDDENHPLAEVLDFLAGQVETYENEQPALPEAEPREVLRLLLEQHGLNQSDLGDCAPQGHISAILSGKRAISKELAKKLGRRFRVSPAVFL